MARGVQRFGSMRGFSKHRSGGGGKFFSKWKEKGSAEVWLHTKELPMAIYRHQFPMVVVREDKKDRTKKETRVWSKNLVCHETTELLEEQYFRERDTAQRKRPPERCSACKLVEWCYQQALLFEETRDKKKPQGLSFITPLFKFEGDDEDETVVLHVGGICNLFAKDKDLSDRMKEDMKRAKISPRHAWKENAWAKLQYAMLIVDNNNPDNGVQIAVETSSLGDKVKKVLDDELENDVDIQKTPYCIKWKYNEKEQNLNEKYGAVALRKMKLTPRVRSLIFGEAPELPDDLTTPFNQQTLRANLERHCVLPDKSVIPWDTIFPSKEQEAQWAKEDEAEAKKLAEAAESEEDEEEEDEDEDESDDESDDDSDEEDGDDSDDDEEEDEDESDEDDDEEEDDSDDEDDEDDEDLVECDVCKKGMPADATTCPHCKTEYDPDTGKPIEKKPEKKLKSRSEAMKAKKDKGDKSKGEKKPKDGDDEPTDDDGIPF